MDTLVTKRLQHVAEIATDPEMPPSLAIEGLAQAFLLLEEQSAKGHAHPATFVRFAETALDLGDTATAFKAVSKYFTFDVPHNQFFVRGLCILALMKSDAAKSKHGSEALEATNSALVLTLQALGIAESLCAGKSPDRLHDFAPLYNVTVHHWSIVRPYLRMGMRKNAIPSLQRVVSSLRVAKDHDPRWLLQNLLSLAVCYAETKDTAKALECALAAEDLLSTMRQTDIGSEQDLREHVLRLKAHLSAPEPPTTGTGGRPTSAQQKVAASAALTATPDWGSVRAKVLSMLQPLLSSAVAVPAHDGFVWSGPWRIVKKGSPEVARNRLEEALKLVDPSILSFVERSKEEDAKETVSFAESPDASRSDGDHLDVVALIAQIAIQYDLFDIAAACIRGVIEHKAASPVSAVLLEIARAELHVRAFSMVDAHLQSGYFEEAPAQFLQTMASLSASEHRDKPMPDRRASYALALSNSVVNARTSDGRVVLLPHGMPAVTTAVPALTSNEVQVLALTRRSEAVRSLKTALSNAERLMSSFLTEYAASVAWNMSIPLLEQSMEHQQVCLTTLSAAATGLELCDSVNYALRARLHATLAQLLAKADMLTSASEHLTKLAKLDYGSSNAASEWLNRPLDEAAEVLQLDVALLQSLHADFEHPSDRVYHILTQAQHAPEVVVRDSLVVKAVELLDAIEDASSAGYFPEAWQKLPTPSYALVSFLDVKSAVQAVQGSQISGPRVKMRRHLRQWLLLAEIAARGHRQDIALHAADVVRKQHVVLPQDRDIALLQCRADVLSAECYAAVCASHPYKLDADNVAWGAAMRNANYRRQVMQRAATVAAGPPQNDGRWWAGELEFNQLEAVTQSAAMMENWGRGSTPGLKPINSDVRCLGMHAPGCPVALLRMKVLVITSLVQALHRGMQLELRKVIESAAKRIWNLHLHVWDANEYGPAVFPVLMDAVLECVRCLVACGSAEGGLIAKLTLICARYHEELGRAQQLQDRLALHCNAAVDTLDGAVLLEHASTMNSSLAGDAVGLQGLHDDVLDPTLAQAIWRSPQQAAVHMKRALILVSSVLAHCSAQFPAFNRLQLICCRHRLRACLLFGTDVTEYGRLQTSIAGTDPAAKKATGASLVDQVAKADDSESDWSSALPFLLRVTAALQAAIHPAGDYTDRVSALQFAATNVASMIKEQTDAGQSLKTSHEAGSPVGSKPPPSSKKENSKPGAKSASVGGTATAEADVFAPFRVGWDGLLTTDLAWQSSTQVLTAAGDTTAAIKARQQEIRMHNTAICCFLWSRMGAVGAQLSATWAPSPDAAVAVFAQRLCANAVSLFPGAPVPQDDITNLKDLPGHTRDLHQFPLPDDSKALSWQQKFLLTAAGSTVDGVGSGGLVNICNSLWFAHVYWAVSICVLVAPQFQTSEEIARLLSAAADHLVQSGTFAARVQDRSLLQQSANQFLDLAMKLPAVQHHQALGRWVSTLICAFESLSEKSASNFPILARMFALQLHCLGLACDWNTGLQATNNAFALLPPAFHDLLWKSRLLFESKLGKDVTLSLSGMRQKDPMLRAKLWLSIARMSSSHIDQCHAYANSLLAVQGCFGKVFIQVEVAEWLLSTGSTCQTVKDMLLDAAASIVSVEGANSSEMEENATDGLSVARSASARSHSHSARSRGTINRTGGDKAPKTKDAAGDAWPTRREISHLDCALRIMHLLAVVSSSCQERVAFLHMLVRFAQQMLQLNCQTLNASVAERTYFRMSDTQRAACGNYDTWISEQQQVGEFRVPHTVNAWTQWLKQMISEPIFWEPIDIQRRQSSSRANTDMLTKLLQLNSDVTASYHPYVISAKSIRNPVNLFLLLEETLSLLSGMDMLEEQSAVLTLLFVVCQLEPCATSPTCQASMRCHMVDWAACLRFECHASWSSKLNACVPACLCEAETYARLAAVFKGELGGELPRVNFGMERRIIAIIECYHKQGIYGAVAPFSQCLRRMPALLGSAHVLLVADILDGRAALAQGGSAKAIDDLIKATSKRIAAGSRWTDLFSCLADSLLEGNQLRDANSMLLQATATADSVLAARTASQQPFLDVQVMCIKLRCLLLDVASRSVLALRQLGMPWVEEWDRLLMHGERAIELTRSSRAHNLEADATSALVSAYWHCMASPMTICSRDEELLRVEASKPELQRKCCWLTLQANTSSNPQLQVPVFFGKQALQTCLLAGYTIESETAARLAGDPVSTYLHNTDLEISRTQNGTSCSDVRSLTYMLQQLRNLARSPHDSVVSAAIAASCQFKAALFEAADGKYHMFPFVRFRERWARIVWSSIHASSAVDIPVDRPEVPDGAGGKSGTKALEKKTVTKTDKEKAKPPKGKADAGSAPSLDLAADFMRLPIAVTEYSALLLSVNSALVDRVPPGFAPTVQHEIVQYNQEVIAAACAALQSCVDTYDLGPAATLAESLVDAYGTLQPVRAALALVQMQSMNSMHYLRGLWEAAELPSGKPALHMKLYNGLLKLHRERATNSSTFRDTLNFLQQESLPFRLTDWRRPLSQVLRSLPFGHRVVVFEMSADLHSLYIGVLWRAGGADGDPLSKNPLEGFDVTHRDLPGIFGFVAAKQLSSTERLDLCSLVNASDDLYKDSWSCLRHMRSAFPGAELVSDAHASTDVAETSLLSVLTKMDTLFSTLLTGSDGAASIAAAIKDFPVVICANRWLATLPLEGLSGLQHASTLSREFSLHFLANRSILGEVRTASEPSEPTSKFALSTPAPDVVPANLSHLQYLADPFGDEGMGENSSAALLQALVAAGSAVPETKSKDKEASKQVRPVSAAYTTEKDTDATSLVSLMTAGHVIPATGNLAAGWQGIAGDQGIPSQSAIRSLLQSFALKPSLRPEHPSLCGGALVFYGHGRLVHAIAPSLLCSTSAPACRLALVLDSVTDEGSARRIAMSTQRTGHQSGRSFENSFDTAALLSLTGVGAVVVHQWASSPAVNKALLYGFMDRCHRNGSINVAACLRSLLGKVAEGRDGGADSVATALKQRVRLNTIVYGVPTDVISS